LGSPLFSEVAGEAVAGVVFVSPYRWPDTAHGDAEFSAAYQRMGPHVPPPGPFALTTYQATWSLLDVIADTTRQEEAPASQPAATDVYLYRWTRSGTMERVK
jgi:ABC-type branched-subunit amino acid transport system substrate-binding protein